MIEKAPSRTRLVLAFATIYLVWGSTYLAIRVGVREFPPALFAAVRFLASAPLLLGLAKLTGAKLRATREELRSCAVSGLLLLVGGNFVLVWAEKTVPSGLAALLVATVPFWMAGIECFRRGGERPGVLGWSGIAIGFVGVVCLIAPEMGQGASLASGGKLLGEIGILLCSGLWALGSIYGKHAPLPRNPLVSTAYQMLFGGAALTLIGLASGELAEWNASAVTKEGALALLYLITAGSCLGFTAYAWLLKNAPAAKVATYAYVNPAVALLLGALLLDEEVGGVAMLGTAIILTGVALVSRDKVRGAGSEV